MDEGRRDCRRAVIWTGTNDAFIIGTSDTYESICGLGDAITVHFKSLRGVIVQPEGSIVDNVNGVFDIIWALMRATE